MKMTREEFITNVFARIKTVTDHRDQENVMAGILRLYLEGFSVIDACALLDCFEEVNPHIEEEYALKRMAQIRSKYVKV